MNSLPMPVVMVVGNILGNAFQNHDMLNAAFYAAGATGDVPPHSCVKKCQMWLTRAGDDPSVDAHEVLGGVIHALYDGGWQPFESTESGKKVADMLAKHGLTYSHGRILGSAVAPIAKTFSELVRARDLASVQKDFERVFDSLVADPPGAVGSACSMVESCCKVIIEAERWAMPSEQTLKPLFHVVAKGLGIDAAGAPADLKNILGGLRTVVDGVAAYRTHEGDVHGKGKSGSSAEIRHARLAAHAALAVVIFLLETWGHPGV